ncbi:hypothetical protein JCM11641_006028 [Rhodosporidiobolus odoratus]
MTALDQHGQGLGSISEAAPATPPPPLDPAHSDFTEPLADKAHSTTIEPLQQSPPRDNEADEEGDRMGQKVSSQPHLEMLQEQLEQSLSLSRTTTTDLCSLRSYSTALSPKDDLHDGEEEQLYMVARRRRGRSAGSNAAGGGEGSSAAAVDRLDGTWNGSPLKRKAKPRPASSYIPSTLWAGQLSALAFPSPRKSSPARLAQNSPPPAASTSTATSSPSAGDPTTPTRRSTSLSPSPSARRSRKSASPSPFRNSLRLPFLPPIPASPLPPILSPPLARSASSPPLLPPVETAGPFLGPEVALVPPTAGLRPSSGWPGEGGADELPRRRSSLLAMRPITSASAPNLSLLVSAPLGTSASPTASLAPHHFPLPSAAPLPPQPNSTDSSPSRPPFPAENPRFDLEADPALLIADSPIEDRRPDGLGRDKDEKEKKDEQVRDEKRYHALVELVETERGYLEGLRVLVKVYFQTLPFLTLLTVADVHAILRNADALLALHERIGERIDIVEKELGWRSEVAFTEEAGNQDDQEHKLAQAAGKIAEVFQDELPNFALYDDFCARHAEALDITRSIVTRPEWEAFERQCAARAAALTGQGETTPSATRRESSPFFPHLSPTPSVAAATACGAATGSPSPAASTPASPSGAASSASSSVPASSIAASSASASRSKLRFTDYAISPVQRVTRYPLVFGQLAKYFAPSPSPSPSSTAAVEHDIIHQCWQGFRDVAAQVDAAKREREGEMRTRVVARRMEFNTPLVGGAFCDILGPTLLVGSLHVVHYGSGARGDGPQGELRDKYLGCFLYRSHLVMAKIRKRASYEPREWLPLRLFDVNGMEEGQGLLTNSIRLTFREHTFELGALCAGEKALWLKQLLAAQVSARDSWDQQDLDEQGHPTLFDDSVVSSVPMNSSTVSCSSSGSAPSSTMQRKSHTRTNSAVSVTSVFSSAGHSVGPSPSFDTDVPLPPMPADIASSLPASTPTPAPALTLATSAPLAPITSAPLAPGILMTTPHLSSRSRFSSTASSLLLGRTPASQRAAVDLRLADVFSEELLSARAHAAREVEESGSLSAAQAKRLRTISGPKRSMTALTSAAMPYAPYVVGAGSAARMLGSGVPSGAKFERRRMSSVEVGLGASERAKFRGAIGFDAASAAVHHEQVLATQAVLALAETTSMPGVVAVTPERGRWATAIRKTKSGGGVAGGTGSLGSASGSGGKNRPRLPEIDTALAESMARGTAKRGMSTPLSAGGSWSRRRNGRDGGPTLGGQLRRVASHNSLDASGISTAKLPHAPAVTLMSNTPTASPLTTPTAGNAAVAARTGVVQVSAVDVERNNSVSSSASSNETGTRSSSSHASAALSMASSALVETPPSSIPPSPDFCGAELADPLSSSLPPSAVHRQPSLPRTSPPTIQRGTFSVSPPSPVQHSSHHSSPRSFVDGMSSVFRLRRRKSTLGLVPPAIASISPSASEERLSPAPSRSPTLASIACHEEPVCLGDKDSKAVKLQRRASTTLNGLFLAKKRAQSSPSLAGLGGYFAGAASSPHLPLGACSVSTSTSTSAAPSAVTSPATSPPTSQPPTPAGGTVVELMPAPAARAPTITTGHKNKRTSLGEGMRGNKTRRGFFGMTPLS